MILQGSMNKFWVRYQNFKILLKLVKKEARGYHKLLKCKGEDGRLFAHQCVQEMGEVSLHHSAPASVNTKKQTEKEWIYLERFIFPVLRTMQRKSRVPFKTAVLFVGRGRDRSL